MTKLGGTLTRRGTARLAAAGIVAATMRPAAAQVPLLMPPSLPCATREGDIAGLLLEGSGAPAGAVVTFGHAFRRGDLPRGAALAARQANGQPLAVQADIKTRHPDGSALFAVVSLAAPALGRGNRLGLVLARGAAAPAQPLDVAAAGAGRSAVVEIVPQDGGTPFRIDLLLRMQDAVLTGSRGALWRSGPLAAEARIHLPVPREAVGGVTSARLVADLALHADGTLWCDAWLRNDIAMRPGGGTARYAMRVLLDGRPVLETGPLTQFQYTGFGRLNGAARGAAAPTPPRVIHDPAYLHDAGAVPRYDLTIGVDERIVTNFLRGISTPEWNRPFSPRGIVQAMQTTGHRADIGPTTAWQAAWLTTGERRAAELAIGQAEADGAIPWHFWDPEGGADGRGGWMDTKRWPLFWTDPRGGRAPRTLLQPVADGTGWAPNRAHQPDLSYVPYLLTGRRAFLDGLLSQGVWGIISYYPVPRGESRVYPAVKNMNVVQDNEVRGSAWSLRTLGNAAWIAPDDDPGAPFLREAAAANWGWLRAMTPELTAQQGEVHGWMPGAYPAGSTAIWQQDFLASSAAWAAKRGNADARAFLAWMANLSAGRFLSREKGFSPNDGIAYLLANRDIETGVPYKTWAEMGAAQRARDWSNGNGWKHSNGYYGMLALMALAGIIDVLDDERARRAYAWLRDSGAPQTSLEYLARDPALAIVPGGMPRVPSRARRCTG
jgi:hypothetical protein